ncbi:MAG: MarR family transcriptional regulator [Cytophagales bacterium]|nr:MAG: MarR family transcriptional regulator [Cytophagales bacterium]
MSIESDIKQPSFQSAYHRVVVNVLFTGNWISNTQLRLLKPFGITMQQYNVLRILRGKSPCPVKVNEITERMLDRMSNASRLVDKLLAKKLVERTECPNDRRAVDVVITPKGLALLKKLDLVQSEWEEKLQEQLTPEQAILLSQLLDQFRSSEQQ